MAALLNTAGAAPAPAKPSALDDWISHLRILMPPEGLIHVGAGNGADLPDYAEWGMSQVVLVEADEANAKRLSELARPHAGWQVHHALVAETDGEATFHVASNPRESGLLPAEALRPLWRNLQAKAQLPMPGMRLDALLPKVGAPNFNWLIVECLPAGALMQGAQRLLESCDVVLARVAMLESATFCDAAGSTLGQLTDLLSSQGLVRAFIDLERMPMIARALFVRPRGSGLRNMAAALERANGDIAKLNVDMIGIREGLAEAELKNAHLQGVLTAGASEIEGLRLSAMNLESKNAAFRVAAADAGAENESLRKSAIEVESIVVSLREVITEFEVQASILRESKASLEIEIRTLQEIVQSREIQIEALSASNQEKAAEAVSLSRRLSQLEDERNRLFNLQSEAVANTNCTQAIIDDLHRHRVSLEESLMHTRSALDERELRLLERDRELSDVIQSKQELMNLSSAQQQKINEIEQEKKTVETSLDLTHKHAHLLEQEREQLNTRIQELAVEIAHKDGNLARFSQELADHATQLQDCRRQLTSAEKNREHFDIEMAKANAQIALIRDVLLRDPSAAGVGMT